MTGGRKQSAWYVVCLLCLAYALSWLDRQILPLLATAVARDLNLSDVQLGLLMGVGFALVYSLAGIPAAQWMDNGQRLPLLCLGLALWSAMTMGAAFATGFVGMIICRAGVAAGEAVLTPASVSLIGDMFGPRDRARPMSVYGAMGSLMVFGGFIIGGLVLSSATVLTAGTSLVPWRVTLFVVGVPGMLLALLIFATVREPERRVEEGAAQTVDLRQFLGYLRRHADFYVPLYLGASAMMCGSVAMPTWVPTLLVRTQGIGIAEAGYLSGISGTVGGVLGILFWYAVIGRIERGRAGKGGGALPVLVMGGLFCAPFPLLVTWDSTALILTATAASTFGTASVALGVPLAIQHYGPGRLRARLSALYVMSMSILGSATGPILVVMFARWWPDRAGALGYGIACVGLLSFPTAALCFMLCYRRRGRSRALHEPISGNSAMEPVR